MMLAGLMSRWMTPRRWAAWVASATVFITCTFSVSVIPSAAWESGRPSMSCMAMYASPETSPTSSDLADVRVIDARLRPRLLEEAHRGVRVARCGGT